MRVHRLVSIFFAIFIVIVTPILNLYYNWWSTFSVLYIYGALFFVWFSLILLFIVDIKKPIEYDFDTTIKYSVIVPVFNEKPEILKECLNSIIDNIGEKQIVIVDDGSTDKSTLDMIKTFKKDYPLIVDTVFLIKNKGKKFAQVGALSYCKYEFCVTVDSDTIFEPDCLLRLVIPLKNPKIGLTNVDCEILNKDINIVTKIQQLQNYGAFKIGRKSLGGLGSLNCASGIGIGFRKSDLLRIERDYLGDRPFGFNCKFGEDRYMTNLFLKEDYKVVFIAKAKAYTDVPNTLKKYLLQQLRWQISGIIEGIHVLSFSWRRRPLLFFYNFFYLLLPYMCISLIITLVTSNLMTKNYVDLFVFFLVIIAASFVRDLVIFAERRDLVKYLIPFTIINLFGLLPLWIIALFRIDEQNWITR